MGYTRRQFADAILTTLGNTSGSQRDFVLSWVIAWTTFETAAGQSAAYNLLNTTQPETGATNYNSVGVKNYTSFQQGIDATVTTLTNGHYDALVNALRNNDTSQLGYSFPLQGQVSGAVEQALTTWGTGAKGQQIYSKALSISTGSSHEDTDSFSGNATTVTAPSGSNVSRPSVKLGPNSGVSDVLIELDDILAITNPFSVPNPPTANIFGANFVDPMGWLGDFGANLGADLGAMILRLLLIIFGVIVAWKVVKQFITIDPIGSGIDALKGGPQS